MDATYKSIVSELYNGPALGAYAVAVGVGVVCARALDKYGVESILDPAVPAEVREFVAEMFEVSAQYVNDACDAFGLD